MNLGSHRTSSADRALHAWLRAVSAPWSSIPATYSLNISGSSSSSWANLGSLCSHSAPYRSSMGNCNPWRCWYRIAAQGRCTSHHSGSRKFGSHALDARPPMSVSLGLPKLISTGASSGPASAGSSHSNGSTRSLVFSSMTPSWISRSSNASPLSARTLAHNTTQSCSVRNATYLGSTSMSAVTKARHWLYQILRFRSSVEYIVEETRRANSLGVAYSAPAPFSRMPGYLHTFIPNSSYNQSASYQFCVDRQSGFIDRKS